MPSFKSTVFALTAVLVSAVSAQRDYWVDPDSVPEATREAWCSDQRSVCPAICEELDPNPPLVNDCDSDALNYGCICGDGQKPNVTEYSLTLPYHMCMEWGNQCVEDCGNGANQCASECRENNPCGAQDPERVNITSSATSEPTPSATGEGEEIFTSTPGEESDEDGDEPNVAAVAEIGRSMGLIVLMSGLMGGFAFML